MGKKEELLRDIDLLRDKLMHLIENKDRLLDSEVIYTSKLLDKVLNEYNDLISITEKNGSDETGIKQASAK